MLTKIKNAQQKPVKTALFAPREHSTTRRVGEATTKPKTETVDFQGQERAANEARAVSRPDDYAVVAPVGAGQSKTTKGNTMNTTTQYTPTEAQMAITTFLIELMKNIGGKSAFSDVKTAKKFLKNKAAVFELCQVPVTQAVIKKIKSSLERLAEVTPMTKNIDEGFSLTFAVVNRAMKI